MPIEPREPSEIRFFDAIRQAYQEGWTGRLGLDSADLSGASCSSSAGDLYLSPRPPLSKAVRQLPGRARSGRLRRQAERYRRRRKQLGVRTPIRIGGPASQDEMPKARLATRRLISWSSPTCSSPAPGRPATSSTAPGRYAWT